LSSLYLTQLWPQELLATGETAVHQEQHPDQQQANGYWQTYGQRNGVASVRRWNFVQYPARFWAALLLVITLAPAALAQATPSLFTPAWAGIWRGTVGDAAVQVCLQHDDYRDFGAYYYLRHLSIISLGKLDAQLVWAESRNSDQAANGPLWRLTSISSSHLNGTWSQGARTLPFSLDRASLTKPKADDPGEAACGNEAFSLPRFTRPVITNKSATLNGVAYTRVLVAPGKQFEDSDTEVFQLQGSTPAIKRVNAELLKTVPTGPGNAAYFTCSMAALGQNGLDGDAFSTIKPLIITTSWMVLENDESDDCGGAHPSSNTSYETCDLHNGVKVNLNDWFTKGALTQTSNKPGSKDQYVTVDFTPPFKKLIDDAYLREDEECKDSVADADTWYPRLTEMGIAFTPELPHLSQSCEEDAVIPFDWRPILIPREN
jgi:hypothetical protein